MKPMTPFCAAFAAAVVFTFAPTSASAALPKPSGVAFDKGAVFTVQGYTNANGTARSEPLSGFPVLVRLAANSPTGFSYADLHSPTNGADLAFVDMDGAGLPFEIDTWNTNGTSLVWVNLPTMTNGTQFAMCWGSDASGKTVCSDNPWGAYLNVWHMNETNVVDSATTGYNGTASGTVALGAVAPIGSGMIFPGNTSSYVSFGSKPNSDLAIGTTIECWIKNASGNGCIFQKKDFVQYRYYAGKLRFTMRGVKDVDMSVPPANGTWYHAVVTFAPNGNNSKLVLYINGSQVYSGTTQDYKAAEKTNSADMKLGITEWTADPFNGTLDEFRLSSSPLSADWIAADYATQSDPGFLAASEAEPYVEPPSPTASLSVPSVGFTNATIVVAVTGLGADAGSADVALEVSAADDFAVPILAETYSTSVTGTRSFAIAGLETNATYHARAFVTNNLQAATAVAPVSFTTLAPGAPAGTVTLHGRDATSISATATVSSSGAESASASVRLEASAGAFETTVSSAWEDVPAGASGVLTVSGLSPLTAYDVRIRLRNEWGIETVSDLGRVATLPSSGVEELYVDSLGNGDGASPESALPTIRAALDIAGPGYTIWVRGGAGRAYGITNDTDTLQISPEMQGLSILAYETTPGDDGRALVTISDTYIQDGNRCHIISNAAGSVTVSGLDFSFGINSVGKKDTGSCSIFRNDGPFATLENCVFRMPKPADYGGSGTGSPLVWCKTKDATNLVVRGCEFYNTRCWSVGHGFTPIQCMSNAQIVGNVFSNVNSVVVPEQKDWRSDQNVFSGNILIASNIVYGANEHGPTENFPGVLRGVYPGPTSAEIAHNRFVFDRNARAQNGTFLQHKVWMSFGKQFVSPVSGGDATLIHHNTFIGGKVAFLLKENTARRTRIYSNLIVLDEGGTNLVENYTSLPNGQTTAFKTPSCIRANAWLADAFNGGAATQIENYDLTPFLEDNIALAAPPDWVCTNDIYHADFYRYRSQRGNGNLGLLGWQGPDGTSPPYIGALPPLYPSGTLMLVR